MLARPAVTLRRRFGLVAILAAAGGLLAACQKPVPNIGVLSGSTYRTIAPSTYCFDDGACRHEPLDFPQVTAAPDSKVLIDVPRQVAANGWQVQAIDVTGKKLKLLSTSGRIANSHSYAVADTINGGKPFIVQVVQYTKGQVDQSKWSFLLTLRGAGNAGSI